MSAIRPWAALGEGTVWRPPDFPETALDDAELGLEMLRRMLLIRGFEKRVNELFVRGLIPGTIHLSHGQEAAEVGTCLALREDDFVTLTHRGHGQALAKGVDPGRLMAEIIGRSTGTSGGRGGSLHVGDPAVGALTGIAIVGSSSPIATGLAFAERYTDGDRVVVNFHGDGAVNKGEWHEALNLAATWSLPVIFVCENNFYGSTTNLRSVMKATAIAERAASYGLPATTVDGNDVVAVHGAVSEAVLLARTGGGPSFLECLTYRQGGHKREDPGTYRPPAEVEAWLARDPIPRHRQRLMASRLATVGELDAIGVEVEQRLDAAVASALAAPDPNPAWAFDDPAPPEARP